MTVDPPDPSDRDWMAPQPRQVKFAGCARCHGAGHDLLFQPFVNPVVVRDVTFTHWALCPNMMEPILLTTFDVPVDDEGITPIETEPLLGSPFDGRDRSDFEAFGG